MRVEIHRGPPDELATEWAELFALDETATPFSSPGWSRAWWEVWGGSAKPWLAVVQDSSGLRGLAPLAITRHAGIRVLRPLSGDHGDYWNILAVPGEHAAVCSEIAREIAAHRREWDAIVLHGLPLDSPLAAALGEAGLRLHVPAPVECPRIDLPDSLEEYLANLPKKHRNDLRRHLRRLDDGELELRDVRDPEDLGDLVARCHELRERQAAAGKGLYGAYRTAAFRDFLLAAARLLVPEGLFLAWELRHGGEVVGVELNLVDRRSFYAYLGTYDPRLSKLGIGKAANAQAIRASIEAGRRCFDFGSGSEPYKYRYGAADRPALVLLAGGISLRSRLGLLAARVARARRERRAGRRTP
jgi:CelD/BcsL family acetyltransferase involved in cellulose biosynthesis